VSAWESRRAFEVDDVAAMRERLIAGGADATEVYEFPPCRTCFAKAIAYHRSSCVIWTRLPLVSFSTAIVDPVTAVGGMVNSAPPALMRS
jgi:hypothetical protein